MNDPKISQPIVNADRLPHVLVVDDDADACASLIRALHAQGLSCRFLAAGSAENALNLAAAHAPLVAVIDLDLNTSAGVDAGFALMRELNLLPEALRTIVLTGHDSLSFGLRAMQLGAASFLSKPANIPHLAALVRDGLQQAALRRTHRQLQREQAETLEVQLAASSDAMRRVVDQLRFAAQTNQPLLLSGETGTGKSLCARLVHRLSARAAKSLVCYQPNFANPDLSNSELFGFVRGAFTGATNDKSGLLAAADGGTLFFDEIDELPKELQVTLLGVLQERRFRAVGANRETHVDFRLISASNADLEERMRQGSFRRDLYHRVSALVIHIPALRERAADIPSLARSLLAALALRESLAVADFEGEALDLLCGHAWPGNIRQLESVVENAALRAQVRRVDCISAADITLKAASRAGSTPSFQEQVESYKRSLIETALAVSAGNQVRAAELLQLDRSSLRRILSRTVS